MKKKLYYFLKSAGKMVLDVFLGVLFIFGILGTIYILVIVLSKIFNI